MRMAWAWLMVTGARGALVAYLGMAWRLVRKVGVAWKRSVVALVASPAVWLASLTVFVGGFWLGHVEGAMGKRAVVIERNGAQRDFEVMQAALAEANARARAAAAEAKRLHDDAKARGSEPQTVASEAVSPPARRPVPRRQGVTPAKSAHATPKAPAAQPAPFWPFKN